MCVCVCVCVFVPGRDSVRGGPRQPANRCRSVRTTCEPWTCWMNSSMLSLTTWLRDNTCASSNSKLSSSSSVVSDDSFSDDSKKMEAIDTDKLRCFVWLYYYTTKNLAEWWEKNLTRPPGHLSYCTFHDMAPAAITGNRLKLWAGFSAQFSQHLSHLLRAGQREQPLQGDAPCAVHRHHHRFTFDFRENILHKHRYGRQGENSWISQDLHQCKEKVTPFSEHGWNFFKHFSKSTFGLLKLRVKWQMIWSNKRLIDIISCSCSVRTRATYHFKWS